MRLSQVLVMKGGGSALPSEAEVLNFAASEPGMRAPRIHRSFFIDDESEYFGKMGYIVMDFIPGQPLDGCWNSLPYEIQKSVSIQVADMIKVMQSVVLSKSHFSPFGGGPCRGKFFTDYSAGPFKDHAEMEKWFNHKLETCKHVKRAPQDTPAFHFTTSVLVQGDISPRNLALDSLGQVWLID